MWIGAHQEELLCGPDDNANTRRISDSLTVPNPRLLSILVARPLCLVGKVASFGYESKEIGSHGSGMSCTLLVGIGS